MVEEAPDEAPQAEDVLGLSPELVRQIADALDAGDTRTVDEAIGKLHYAEFANLIEQLSEEQRAGLIERMRPHFDPDVLPELDDSVRDEVVERLGTATVARAVAMKELTFANARRNLSKAVVVGVLNGLIFATIIGGVAWGWSGRHDIGLVIASAVIGTLILATVLGTAIPIVLTRVGVDPAVASGPTLTTMTDSIAFFTFLGLSTLILI